MCFFSIRIKKKKFNNKTEIHRLLKTKVNQLVAKASILEYLKRYQTTKLRLLDE